MSKVTWAALTAQEQHWLQQMAVHSTPMLPAQVASRLLEIGLAVQKLGGAGISQKGRDLLMKRPT